MPALKARSGAALVAAKKVKVRWSGAIITAKAYWVKSGGVLVKVWANMHTASGTPSAINAQEPNGSASFGVTASVSGGTGPFAYSWAWVAGGLGMSLANTTSAAVQINASGTNTLREGTLRCTVTDTGNGNAVASFDTSVAIQFGTPL